MRKSHTSNTIASNSAHQTIDPIGVLLRLAHDDWVSFLENLVYSDESFESLDLVGENGLPAIDEIPISDYFSESLLLRLCTTYTFMPAQKAADDLWSHV